MTFISKAEFVIKKNPQKTTKTPLPQKTRQRIQKWQ